MNPVGIRNDLDAGDITWGEIYGIQPFGKSINKSKNLTGQDIRDIFKSTMAKRHNKNASNFRGSNTLGMQTNLMEKKVTSVPPNKWRRNYSF